jgi:hypothetical protein
VVSYIGTFCSVTRKVIIGLVSITRIAIIHYACLRFTALLFSLYGYVGSDCSRKRLGLFQGGDCTFAFVRLTCTAIGPNVTPLYRDIDKGIIVSMYTIYKTATGNFVYCFSLKTINCGADVKAAIKNFFFHVSHQSLITYRINNESEGILF